MPTIVNKGVTLHYETDGDPKAKPLLLIMGLGMQLTSWPQPLVEQLVAQGYYVIRFDNRDAGLSSKLDHHGTPNLAVLFVKSKLRLPIRSPYTLHDMADDALAVLNALDVKTCHVVGASMGGMIAQILTAQHPTRVASLTSIMSSSGRHGLPGPTAEARRIMMSGPADRHDPEQVVEYFVRMFRAIGSPAYPTPEAQMRTRIKNGILRSGNSAGTPRQINAIVACGSRVKLLEKIQRPSLIIHGSEDALVPLKCGEDTAKCIPGAVLRVIPGMGHDLPEVLLPGLVSMINAHCQGKNIPKMETLLKKC
jgi:pimeloyl-ACP methyl ester carboxylesterase